jgi:hypothetical protein
VKICGNQTKTGNKRAANGRKAEDKEKRIPSGTYKTRAIKRWKETA